MIGMKSIVGGGKNVNDFNQRLQTRDTRLTISRSSSEQQGRITMSYSFLISWIDADVSVAHPLRIAGAASTNRLIKMVISWQL